jgi:hypothetical protein
MRLNARQAHYVADGDLADLRPPQSRVDGPGVGDRPHPVRRQQDMPHALAVEPVTVDAVTALPGAALPDRERQVASRALVEPHRLTPAGVVGALAR